MNSDYRTTIIKQLRDQQVRFAPRDKKVEQANRAERLIGEIDPARVYSNEYLCFRITDYRPDSNPQQTMPGDQVRHDLRLFVEDVSDSADISVNELVEPVHTVDELSKMFNVSTKTIQRWRDQGLVSRRARSSTSGSESVFCEAASNALCIATKKKSNVASGSAN